MATLAALSLAILVFIYAGYPLLLRAIVRIRGARPVRRGDHLPPVSLVISAYNEADVIRGKLENAVRLDYPRDLLEIVVISDASTDSTDDIVREFTASHGVVLARQTERGGKTVGLNRTVPTLRGEIVVFSDANALYERNALKMLVRNFADPEVGCVTGQARYVEGNQNAADSGERTYWDYETSIKCLETALGSTVGGDGAIYGIRAHLWQSLPPAGINDFLNPLQIVNAGWRAVYEPEAICYEDTAGTPAREYRRRVRIVSRSWRAVFQTPGVLNPFRTGWFSFSLVSHKMLRWLTGAFVAGATAGFVGLILQAGNTWSLAAAGVAASGAVAFRPTRRVAALAGYFSVIQVASLVGVVKGTFGRVEGTWTTPRDSSADSRKSRESSEPVEPSKAKKKNGTPRGFFRTRIRRIRRSAAPMGKTLAYRGGVFWALRRLRPSRNIAILRYHAVCGPEGYPYADPHLCVSPSGFERHVAYLTANYEVLPLPEIVSRMRNNRPLPANTVALTFDDGYADNLAAARTLNRYGASGTFYLTACCMDNIEPFWPSEIRYLFNAMPCETVTVEAAGKQIALPCSTPKERAASLMVVTHLLKAHTIPVRDHIREQLRALAGHVRMPNVMLTWNEVNEMHRLGMTIGAHTMTHANLPSAGIVDATKEITGSKKMLESHIGHDVTMFSYPNGGAESYFTPELERVVARAGYDAATTSRNGFATSGCDLYAIKRVQVAERLEDLIFALEVERFMLAPN
jgi:peptidoglycan/xylan/chitin deacetylase (PgdA/CDA1 family)/glycosyltransferase involved in cell wall biosynthesis